MVSPCYTDEHIKKSYRSRTKSNKIDYLEFKKKKLRRQAYIRRQQQLALRRLIFFSVLLIIACFVLSKVAFRYVYLPIKNSRHVIEIDKNFFNSSEAMLANDSFLGHKYLFENPYKYGSSLMRNIPLNKEIRSLKRRLLPILTSDKNYRPGLFIWDSRTNNFVSINGDEYFATASIIKIPVLLELFRQVDEGLISMDKSVIFTKHHLAEGSGGLQYKPLGQSYNIDYLARIMIQFSDNTATNILLDEIGGTKVLNKVMKAWGIQNGKMENWLPDLTGTNVMSPKDFAKMIYNIDNPSFLSHSSTKKIMGYMTRIKHRNLIKSGVPIGAKLAHKTGDIGKMVGDAGIVTMPDGRKIIMVAVVERPWNSYKAKEMIREASRVTFDYFSHH